MIMRSTIEVMCKGCGVPYETDVALWEPCPWCGTPYTPWLVSEVIDEQEQGGPVTPTVFQGIKNIWDLYRQQGDELEALRRDYIAAARQLQDLGYPA